MYVHSLLDVEPSSSNSVECSEQWNVSVFIYLYEVFKLTTNMIILPCIQIIYRIYAESKLNNELCIFMLVMIRFLVYH